MRDTGTSTDERLEIHNISVDEQVAKARMCGHVHLPTGRTCILAAGHSGSCGFEHPERAHSVAQRELDKG